MTCQECDHEKGKCKCLCCCPISQIECVYCILPVLGYRQVKKILRMKKIKRTRAAIKKMTNTDMEK